MGNVRRVSLGLAAVLVWAGSAAAQSNHEPANKTAASGASAEVVGPSEEVTLLQATFKSSNPADVLLAVTLECSIVTDVTTVGDDDQSASAQVEIWVEIDGNPVQISSEDATNGRVVFCNRTYRRQTSLFDDDDATIATFFSTRSTHGFNWVALNLGAATHDIVVKATLTQQSTENATASAVIGNRTLIVDPIKTANDETVEPSDPPPPSDEGESGLLGIL